MLQIIQDLLNINTKESCKIYKAMSINSIIIILIFIAYLILWETNFDRLSKISPPFLNPNAQAS